MNESTWNKDYKEVEVFFPKIIYVYVFSYMYSIAYRNMQICRSPELEWQVIVSHLMLLMGTTVPCKRSVCS